MASLKENVLASGFALMTEDELYEVNGGFGRRHKDDFGGDSGISIKAPKSSDDGFDKSDNKGKKSEDNDKKGPRPTIDGGTIYDPDGEPKGVFVGVRFPVGRN